MRGFADDPNVAPYVRDIYLYLEARADGSVGRGRPTARAMRAAVAPRPDRGGPTWRRPRGHMGGRQQVALVHELQGVRSRRRARTGRPRPAPSDRAAESRRSGSARRRSRHRAQWSSRPRRCRRSRCSGWTPYWLPSTNVPACMGLSSDAAAPNGMTVASASDTAERIVFIIHLPDSLRARNCAGSVRMSIAPRSGLECELLHCRSGVSRIFVVFYRSPRAAASCPSAQAMDGPLLACGAGLRPPSAASRSRQRSR